MSQRWHEKKGQEDGATTREGEVAARARSTETHEYHNVFQQQNRSGCYSINKRKERALARTEVLPSTDGFQMGKKERAETLGVDGGEKRLEYLGKEEKEDNDVILERMVKWYPD